MGGVATELPIDRAAAAVRACFQTWGLPELHPEQYEAIAAGVIRSLREPSEAMIKAGNASKPYNLTGYCEGTIHPVAQRAWAAMIEAALAEGEDSRT